REGFTRSPCCLSLVPTPARRSLLPQEAHMASALDGVTVLDLSTGPAAALATMFLGDHGARVVRLTKGEARLRDGGFVVWARGKDCATLDLDAALEELDGTMPPAPGTPAGEYVRLLRGADVLVEDFAPSSARGRLVPWPRLKEINPRLVAC